ncbi:MAG: aromatic amino acid lyase [SAR324 cluster bacterium]|nr:aromatic amino acid lyase [SAR324 cluster bacterium]
MKKLIIHHQEDLSLNDIISVGRHQMQVILAVETETLLRQRRQQIENFIQEQDTPAYGFNRGFGHNVDLPVQAEDLTKLQENLILSHSVGVGDHAEKSIVRITMLLRAKSLAKGYSGVRPELILKIIEFLNFDIIPLVPQLGSVGASGDLSPLSHIALALIGHGKVLFQEEILETQEALKKAGVKALKLAVKEGLALNNGVQFMNAMGLFACQQIRVLLKSECVQTSMVAQVMLAPDMPYRPDFHQVRPHPGAIKAAGWIWELMQNSPIREVHRRYDIDGQIQDPYNLRCAAQILGACAELIDDAEKTLLIEANSATDNPILMPYSNRMDETQDRFSGEYVEIISGGHFHGMPVAVKIYHLFQALSIIGNLAHQRTVRFVDQAKNKRLGRDLKWPFLSDRQKAISSGMMMLEYTSAALVNELWAAGTPSHLFNISTNSGQEDHVSMGSGLAVRLLQTIPKTAHIQAIELAYLTQAMTIRKALKFIPSEIPVPSSVSQDLSSIRDKYQRDHIGFEINAIRQYQLSEADKQFSPSSEAVYEAVKRSIFPTVVEDRMMADQVCNLAEWISSGQMLMITDKHVPLRD